MKSRSISDVNALREQVRTLDINIEKLKCKRNKTIDTLQQRCKHPATEIIEVHDRNSRYELRASPPYRVCKLCGLAEEGWGCGYWKLATQEKVVTSSDEAARSNYMLKFYWQEEINRLRFT